MRKHQEDLPLQLLDESDAAPRLLERSTLPIDAAEPSG